MVHCGHDAQLRYRLTSDTYSQLIRLDTFLH
jgi:hypothetical protein